MSVQSGEDQDASGFNVGVNIVGLRADGNLYYTDDVAFFQLFLAQPVPVRAGCSTRSSLQPRASEGKQTFNKNTIILAYARLLE